MNWIRGVVTVALLLGVAALVQREQAEGRLRQVDEAFLDFLVANSRDRFETLPGDGHRDHPVVKVALHSSDAADYSDWPPQPIDWQMLLKGLQRFEPSVLVITTPLSWGHPPPDFVTAVAEALLPFPSVVLAAECLATEGADETLEASDIPPAFLGDLDTALPAFERMAGDPVEALVLQSIVTPPDAPLRRSGEIGLILDQKDNRLSAVVRSGDQWIPTLPIQALVRQTRTPYANSRIRLGTGAGLYLEGGIYAPLTRRGEMNVPAGESLPIPEINALDLLTEGFADFLRPADKEALGTGKVIVVGIDDDAEGAPELDLHASAIAGALSTPRIRILPLTYQWIVWGVAALFALLLVVRVRREKALRLGMIAAFLAFAAGFVAFQSSLWWFPPSMPLALLATGAVFGRLFGYRAPAHADTASPVRAAAVDGESAAT